MELFDEDVAPKKSKSSNNIAFLSLFMMILAFFIILNSLASLDKAKSSDVMGVLESSFTALSPQELNLEPQEEVRTGEANMTLQSKVLPVFETLLPKFKTKLDKARNALIVEFAPGDIFSEDFQKISPEGEKVLASMAIIMATPPADHQYIVEFLLANGTAKQRQKDPEILAQNVKKVGIVARGLLGQRVLPRQIRAGLFDSKKDIARFVFLAESANQPDFPVRQETDDETN